MVNVILPVDSRPARFQQTHERVSEKCVEEVSECGAALLGLMRVLDQDLAPGVSAWSSSAAATADNDDIAFHPR